MPYNLAGCLYQHQQAARRIALAVGVNNNYTDTLVYIVKMSFLLFTCKKTNKKDILSSTYQPRSMSVTKSARTTQTCGPPVFIKYKRPKTMVQSTRKKYHTGFLRQPHLSNTRTGGKCSLNIVLCIQYIYVCVCVENIKRKERGKKYHPLIGPFTLPLLDPLVV